jgi:hypothetical protein
MKSGIMIIAILMAGAFIAGYFAGSFNANPTGSNLINGPNATLYVLILNPQGLPISNLEVDLWHDTTLEGPPDAGVSFTNSSGIAVFLMPKGGYLMGFKLLNFPDNLEAQREMPVSISDDFNSITVNLYNKTQ